MQHYTALFIFFVSTLLFITGASLEPEHVQEDVFELDFVDSQQVDQQTYGDAELQRASRGALVGRGREVLSFDQLRKQGYTWRNCQKIVLRAHCKGLKTHSQDVALCMRMYWWLNDHRCIKRNYAPSLYRDDEEPASNDPEPASAALVEQRNKVFND